EARSRFGFFLDALEFGTPPHGGIAPGIERLLMVLVPTENIRDVMAFPKTAGRVTPQDRRQAVSLRFVGTAGVSPAASNEFTQDLRNLASRQIGIPRKRARRPRSQEEVDRQKRRRLLPTDPLNDHPAYFTSRSDFCIRARGYTRRMLRLDWWDK